MSNATKKKVSSGVIDLDALVVRNSTTETLRRVRQRQANERAAAEVPVMSLRLPSNDDFTDLVDLDESDPLLAQLAADAAGTITLGTANESPANENHTSSDDDSDDEDYVRAASRKRKQDQASKSKPVFTADNQDDSSDDDFQLSTLKKKSSASAEDSSDDDFALAALKRQKTTHPNSKKKQKSATKKRAVSKVVAANSKSSTVPSTTNKASVAVAMHTSRTGQLFSSNDEEEEPDVDMTSGAEMVAPSLCNEDTDEDSDEPLAGLALEERHVMKALNSRLVADEERLSMQTLDDNIVAAEEAATVLTLGRLIRDTLDNTTDSGGLITVTAVDPRKPIPPAIVELERDWDIFEQKQLFEGATGMLKKLEAPTHENRSGVLDVDYMGDGELHVTKELSKFAGGGGMELLVTEEDLEKGVVAKLRQNFILNTDNFGITVSDKKGDRSTIIVAIRGQENVVERAKTYLQLLIRAKQLRLIPLEAKLQGSLDARKTRKMHEARALVYYKRFKKKTAQIRDIEFGDFHAGTVWSSMWKVHKHTYGNVCNPQCRCVTDLHHLTSSVVSDQEKKKRKTGDTFKPPIEVGFCSRFGPKFMPLLRKEFPNETNEELFQRLLFMWGLHKVQRRFGFKCQADCSCAEGWSSVFKRGASKGKEGDSSDSKIHEASTNSVLSTNISVGTRIPSRRTSDSDAPSGFSAETLNSKQKKFELTFDTRQQMGFFCVTRKHQKHNVCKILSVNSLGVAKDSRLRAETIVTAVARGDSPEWLKIDSHEDLKSHFESCRKFGGGDIRVRFINTDVKSAVSRYRDDTSWTPLLHWDGKPNFTGWAGGALSTVELRADKRESAASVPTSSTATTIVPKNEPPNSSYARTAVQNFADQGGKSRRALTQSRNGAGGQRATPVQPVPVVQTIVEPRKSQPRHHGATKPASIFMKKSDKPRTSLSKNSMKNSMFRNLSNSFKKPNASLVKWRNENDIRLYDPKDMSYEEREDSAEKFTDSNDAKVVQRPADFKSGDSALHKQLLAAISHKTCVDVFALLKGGAESQPADVDSKDMPEVYAKRIRDSLKSEFERNPSDASKQRLADAQMKVALIKIFDRARDVMDNCRFLKKWGRYEFKIDRVENFALKPDANPSFDDKFQCCVSMQGESIGQTPWVKLTSSMSWSAAEAKRFAFKHNINLPNRGSRNTDVEFKLQKVGGPMAEKLELATETRSMSEIGKAATLTSFHLDVAATDRLESARVIISVQKLQRESKKRIDDKRRIYQKELKKLIDDIKQFNDDNQNRKLAGMHELDFNIQHNTTPLHSAVYLNDVDLVRKLLERGADVKVRDRSASMTPQMLAMSEIMAVRKIPSETQGYEIEKLQKILKLLGYTGTFDDDEIAFSPTDEEQAMQGTDTADTARAQETAVRTSLLQQTQDAGAPTRAKDVPVSSHQTKRTVREIAGAESQASNTNLGIRQTRSSKPSTMPQDGPDSSSFATVERKQHPMSNEMPSSRKRSRSPENRPLQIAKVARRESYNKHNLPAMTMAQLTDGKRMCTYYNTRNGCKRGRGCNFAHLEIVDPTAIEFGSKRASYNRARDLHVKKAVDRNGCTVFTAMFRDATTNSFLKARGGSTLGANSQGIFWYESEADAVEAIELVITLWENPELERQSPRKKSSLSSFKSEPPRQSNAQRVQPAQSRAPDASRSTQHPEKPQGSNSARPVQPRAMTDEERGAFDALVSANLSNTVMKILKIGLSSREWTISNMPQDGSSWVHVSFTKFIAKNFPKQSFQSMDHGPDCQYINGKWYHRDLRRAKASAVLEFLKFCKKIGILWSLTQTMTMEELPFIK